MNHRDKQKADVDLIRDRLVNHGPATNAELSEITLRYGARIHQLREIGYLIETKHEGGGTYSYIYRGFRMPSDKPKKTKPGDQAIGLVRWYLKYHEATGCQIDGCVDGGIPFMGSCGYMEAEQCEYCAMIFEAKKLIKEIDK